MDFNDSRGMKVVLVAHCILNQNARLARCAESPCAVTKLVEGPAGAANWDYPNALP